MATENQKQVFNKVQEKVGKGGKVAISKEMEGTYSKSVAKNPQKLTGSKGWQELMEQNFPDKDLAKVHKEGLKAGKKILVNGKSIGIEEPDYATRHKYLDTAYKLKGVYAPEVVETKTVNLNLNLDKKTSKQILELTNLLKKQI